MSQQIEVTDEDRARIVEYLDGKLDESASTEFELRLSEDSALALVFEECADADRLQRLARPAAGAPRALISMRAPLLASLAAAAMVALGVGVLLKGAKGSAVDVALVASAVSARNYEAQLGVDSEGSPFGSRSGAGTDHTSPPDAAAYLSRIRSEEDATTRREFGSPSSSVEAGYFLVRFEASEPMSAVVVTIAETGAIEIAYPRSDDPPGANRFGPGRVHALPGEPIELSDDGRAPVWRGGGFLVPLGAARIDVLAGFTEARVDAALLAALNARIEEHAARLASGETSPRNASRALGDWLSERRFEVRSFVVVEP